jgi:hypothetical protein
VTWVDAALWAAVRVLPAVRADWLDVPCGEGRIGPDWPWAWAARVGAPIERDPDGGLVRDLGALGGGDRTDPTVRQFYEHTARFRLAVRARWLPGMRWVAAVWARAVARRWGQLDLPLGGDEVPTNEILRTGAPDPCQWWVRRYAEAGRAMYVSRYEVVRIPSEPAPVVRITFPVPGGAWVVVFRVVHDGDAFVLTEDGGRPGGPGLYLVPTGGPGRYVRALREEIRVEPMPEGPGPTGCRASHRLWLCGVRFLTLDYDLPTSEATRGTA